MPGINYIHTRSISNLQAVISYNTTNLMGTDTAIIQVTHMLVVLSQLLRVSIDCLILQYLICVKPR